jgi:16S rRNA (guanine1207-N2)-methyltransferase
MEVRPQEQALIARAGQLPLGRVLCTTVGRGQLAAALAVDGGRDVVCWMLDLYQAEEARRAIGRLPPNLHIACQTDPPGGDYAAAALCFSRQGDAELARETLQSAHEQLAIGGRLAVAIDNPQDQWIHEQLRGLFDKVTRQSERDAAVYLATKTGPLKKHKQYTCEVAFRDGERLIRLRTRPGVFSHRQVDGGARALVKSMHVEPGVMVLDLGCGSGAVGIAAALRQEHVRVHAIDSNPRAIEAVEWAAKRNGLGNRVMAQLDCDGRSIVTGGYDLVLANPPYYSNFRIARVFVTIAHRALRPGGRLLVVTKTPQWFVEKLAAQFRDVEDREVGRYRVVSGVRL